MTDSARVRRLQDTLILSGTGVIGFAVWSLVKVGMFLSLVDEDALRQLLDISDGSLMFTVYLSLIAMIVVDVGMRAYIGLSARADGRGKKKSPLYLVVAAVVALANVSSLGAIALSTSITSSPLGMAVSILIEATAITALVLVIYSSIRLRQISRMAE